MFAGSLLKVVASRFDSAFRLDGDAGLSRPDGTIEPWFLHVSSSRIAAFGHARSRLPVFYPSCDRG